MSNHHGAPHGIRRAASVLAMAVVVSLGTSVPALGAVKSPAAATTTVVKAKKAAPVRKVTKVTLKGVLVSRSATSLTVLSSAVKVTGAGVLPTARLVTVNLPRTGRLSTRAARATYTIGHTVQATGSGTVTGTSLALTAPQSITVRANPTRAWVGRIMAVDAATGTLTVTRRDHVDGTGTHTDADRAGRGYGRPGGAMIMNTSAASVSLDGVPARATDLRAGHYVVTMGSGDGDVATAANVFAFTTEPTLVRGRVAAVSGTRVTLGGRTASPIDLAEVPVALNGATSTVARLTRGTNLLIVSAAGSTTPAVALGFNAADRHSAWHHGAGGFHRHQDTSGIQPQEPAGPTPEPTTSPEPTQDPAPTSDPTPEPTSTPQPSSGPQEPVPTQDPAPADPVVEPSPEEVFAV